MITPIARKPYVLSFICACMLLTTYGQADTKSQGYYDSLSLKDLLNVKIVSVSKASEFLFDAPLSASVITREDIRKAGSTSIMEALRLVPGVIVREQSNGNYDIHLRGMDNLPPNASFDIASTTTLVMIDNRPIYSYLRGGTFWETLPVDLNDVQRIEIVRGPAAALYGPNAVNGVINIITRQTKKDGLYLVANNQQGSYQTFINNASVGYQSGKFSVIASGNYQHRNRTQTSYFEFNRNTWLDHPAYFINFRDDTAKNIQERYPYQELAMKKYGGNVFVNYDPAHDISLSFSTGIQHSTVQKVSAENEITPLSTASSDSRYADLHANIKNISAQFSYNRGTQEIDYDPGNKYDFSTLDANIEYNYTREKLSIKPGLSYRNAIYDDTEYSDIVNKNGIFNNRGQITTKAASLRTEYKLLDDKLRLVAAVAANKFNYPDTIYLSLQFAATYKMNKNHLFRAVYSRAPRSSNVFDTYVDQTIAHFPIGYKKFKHLALAGDKNLKLLIADLREIGYRGMISKKLTVDVEIFDIRAKNSNILITSKPYMELQGTDTILWSPIRATNLPLRLVQQGITVSLNYTSRKWQVKPFITLQKTNIKDYAPSNYTADAGLGPNHIYSGIGNKTQLESTPTVFGGASVNYAINSKLGININSYFYSSQTYYHLSNLLLADGVRGIDHIDAKVLVNAAVSYEAVKGLRLFVNGKNLLNDKSREFFRADAVPFMLLAGLNFEF